jgi:hypothetical protein
MKVQLNHPGHQKKFKIGNGYIKIGKNIIREWNRDNVHYRKFIRNKGYYLSEIDQLHPFQDDLDFWGEWEGNSFFKQFTQNDFRIFPNGIHSPFHSLLIQNQQNTDPYIYGDCFKYCICKQTGRLCNLVVDDLILFGTTMPSIKKFYIDTVFIVKDFESSLDVKSNRGKNFSNVYSEETLERLNEYLNFPTKNNKNKIYKSKTWWDDKKYFSFVPCKKSIEENKFERFYLSLEDPIFNLSINSTGKSYLKKCTLTSKELWNEVIDLCIKQDFQIGIKFEEPSLNNNFYSANNKDIHNV